MTNSPRKTHRQSWITAYRVVTSVLLVALVVIGGILLARPAPSGAPSASEIATAVNGPSEFQRPSSMEYVAKTNSCVVGGTVTSSEWHVGTGTVPVFGAESDAVDYTVFEFLSDQGRKFSVSQHGALYTEAGENLGLQLYCDPATMMTDQSFGLINIVYGGR